MEINLVYRNEFIELVTPIIENEKVKVLWIIASQ